MIKIKTDQEIHIMEEGGKILNEVMTLLLKNSTEGVCLRDLDLLAQREIKARGGKPSFKMVKGYNWSICACINDIVVHGVPNDYIIKKGDVVGIDCGVCYRGFHTDSSWSIHVNGQKDNKDQIDKFLDTGIRALDKALDQAEKGKYIYDISKAIQDTVEEAGYSVVKTLIGHGIGKNLHEDPEIPGFVRNQRDKTALIKPGMALAVEVIYNMGSGEVIHKGSDGWTIATKDGKISGLFEATVAVTSHGLVVLTKKYGPPGNN